MLKDIFVSLITVIAYLFFYHQILMLKAVSHKQPLVKHSLTGIFFGLMGIVLMFLAIRLEQNILVDLRHLAILFAGLVGSPVSTILASVIIAAFRVIFYGLGQASLIGALVAVLMGCMMAALSRLHLKNLKKFVLYLGICMSLTSCALVYLLRKQNVLVEVMLYFWVFHILGGVLGYIEIRYFKKAKESTEAMDYYRIMADNLLDVLSTHKPDGTFIYASPSITLLLGYPLDRIVGKRPYEFIHPEDVERVVMNHKSLLSKREVSIASYRMKRIDGSYIWVESIVRKILSMDGAVMISMTRDITTNKKLEQTLMESEERFRKAFHNAPIGMCLQTITGQYIKVNQALCDITGYTKDEMLQMSYTNISHPDDLYIDMKLKNDLLKGIIPYYHFQKRYYHKDGTIIWVTVGLSLLSDIENKFQYYVVQIQDITSQKKAEEELRKAKMEAESNALIDYLTQVMNRRAFDDRFLEECHMCQRLRMPMSLILTDVDHFKRINDTYGHQTGDIVLKSFVNCLEQALRPYDFIGRYGGEEFLIGLPNTTSSQAYQIAERLRSAVEKLPILDALSNKEISITASFGISSGIGGLDLKSEELIQEADKAMYEAKKERNKVCLYTPE